MVHVMPFPTKRFVIFQESFLKFIIIIIIIIIIIKVAAVQLVFKVYGSPTNHFLLIILLKTSELSAIYWVLLLSAWECIGYDEYTAVTHFPVIYLRWYHFWVILMVLCRQPSFSLSLDPYAPGASVRRRGCWLLPSDVSIKYAFLMVFNYYYYYY